MKRTTWLNFPAFLKEVRQIEELGAGYPRVAIYKRRRHCLVSKSFSQWCPWYPLAASGIWCGLLSLSCLQVCPLTPEPATGPAYAAEFTVPPEDKPRAARRTERTLRSLSKTGTCGGGEQSEHTFCSDSLLESDLFRYTVFHPRSINTKYYHKKIKSQIFPLKKFIF